MKIIFLITFLALSACAGEPQKKKNDGSDAAADSANGQGIPPGANGEKAVESTETLIQKFARKFTQNKTEEVEFKLYSSINKKLCERLLDYQNQCPAIMKLSRDGSAETEDCTGSGVALPVQSVTYKAKIQGSGKYKFVADSFESSPVEGNGTETEITWVNRWGQKSAISPRVYEIKSFRVCPADASCEGNTATNAISQLSLKANDVEFVNQSNMQISGMGYYEVLAGHFLGIRTKIEQCNVKEAEVNDILVVEKNRLSPQETDPAKVGAQAAPKDTSDEGIRKELVTVETQLAARAMELQKQKDRTIRLKRLILADQNIGCWADMPVFKLEVKIWGNGPLSADMSGAGDYKSFNGFGDPSSFNLYLGPRLTYGFNANGVFTPEGGVAIFKVNLHEQGVKVRDLEAFVLGKGGAGKSGKFETHRYQLSGVEVRVNDKPIYATFGSYVFTRQDMNWGEGSIRSNPAYFNLMTRSDCQRQD